MNIEFAIAGSPNDAFYSQMAMFRLGLTDLGGVYKSARVICVFGDSVIQPVPERWREAFADIDVVWADPEDFDRRHFVAQGVRRLAAFSESADVAIVIDADTLPMAPFDSLLKNAKASPAFRACSAQKPPNLAGAPINWTDLVSRLGLSSSNTLENPFYINAGVIMGTPDMFAAFEPEMERIRSALTAEYPGDKNATFFGAQIAFALATHTLGMPNRTLPLRYNFPNTPDAAQQYPAELERIKICHFFSQTVINRWEIFASETGFKRFLNANLINADKALQDRVLKLTGGTYPFPELTGSVQVKAPNGSPKEGPVRILPPFIAAGADTTEDPIPLAHFIGWSRAMASRKNWHSATDMAQKAIANYPDATDAYAALGEALLASGDTAAALPLLERALEEDADNASYASTLSIAYESQGRIDDAFRCARIANDNAPEVAATYVRLANLAAAAGDPESVLTYCRRGLEIDPDDASLHAQLSDALETLGQFDDALEARSRAVELEPSRAVHQFRLGRLLMKTRAPSLAKLFFLNAVHLNPGHVAALHNLGNIYEAEGRLDAAIDATERAFSLAPNNRKLAKQLELLRAQGDERA